MAALTLTGVVGCSDDGSTASSSSERAGAQNAAPGSAVPAASPSVVDASVVRGWAHYDYDPAPAVDALANEEPSVTVGEVAGWSDGRAVEESDGQGYANISHNAVLEVVVADSVKSVGGQESGGRIFVEVPRGGEILIDGEPPEGTEPVLSSIEELNEAVPPGTRVIVIGSRALTDAALSAENGGTVLPPADGQTDATLLRPDVQGLIFEDETGAFESGLADEEQEWGWLPPSVSPRKGFDYLVKRLSKVRR